MKTIRQIRLVQISYQFFVFSSLFIASIFIGTILEFYVLDKHLGNKLSYIFLFNLSLSALLWMIVKRLRCPVCRNVFVGKESPELFTRKCRHCGRRSGDTH
ncbi:MAG: hypothetical protein IT465_05325 [Moraxellaceae bacterium]|nr:hypothetical protein [Moraxellaceae bacterium]